ncbi:MAG: SPOR domain-containing protein [Rhizobiales bacterium]|nr:SPOR domain-containing protein [Hyphomicrobiales bacterium]
MPKISDEFKSQPFATPAAKPDGRAPQPVVKLAPMAPRAHGQQPGTTAPVSAEERRRPEVQNSEGLAEKLRAQRAAAEMLAVQRVSAARQRAEARVATEPRSPALQIPSKDTPAKDRAPSRPKFSFADDDQAAKRQEPVLAPDKGSNGMQRNASASSMASLIPPRPALGGDRSQSSLLRPAGAFSRPDTPPTFRPIDPATGYAAPSSRTAPSGGQRAFPQESGGVASINRNLTRTPSYDPYRRGQDSTPYGTGDRGEELRGDPRFGRSLSSRGQMAEDELDDVFEEEAPPPRRRAGASDYQSAYREAEEDDTEDPRRSNGPWLLLLALLVAAFATGGVILLWSKNTNTASTTPTNTVPVVEAPEEPAKTAAEKPVDGASDVAGVSRKQIYDRIVGDQEVTGDTVVPTEVTPIQPESDETDAGGIPQPTGTNDQDTDEVVPLALPPAPGQKTEGRIDQDTDQQVVATAGQSGVEEVKTQTTSESGGSIASLLPATGAEEEAAVPATTTDTSSSASVDSGSAASTESVEPEARSPTPVQKKAAAKKKKQPADSTASLTEPLVIVPPVEIAAPSQETTGSGTLSSADTAQKQPPARRKRTLFDLFNGNKSDDAPATDAVATTTATEPAPQQQADETQVASLPAKTVQTAPEKQTGGTGYVVQLASFPSPGEAQSEYTRLRSKYSSVIGELPSRITQSTVAGSTRHSLGLGPLATREQAKQVCDSLYSAGERDCVVRKQ